VEMKDLFHEDNYQFWLKDYDALINFMQKTLKHLRRLYVDFFNNVGYVRDKLLRLFKGKVTLNSKHFANGFNKLANGF
jgi:hypothetical protein